MSDMVKESILYVARFNGVEEYELSKATWNLYEDDGKMNLCIFLDSEKALKQNEDLSDGFQGLNWELNLVKKSLKDQELIKGFKAKIPEGFDEKSDSWITNFYYFEHDGSDKNTIEIVEREGEKLLINLTGEIVDVNFYDDSKPKSKLSTLAWFKKNPETIRSMS